MTIRQATAADLPRIVSIYNQAVAHTVATFDTEPKSVEERRGWFDEHDERFSIFVGEQNGGVVGWGSLSRWSDRCAYKDTCEISLYVDEEHQGRGIGKEILRRTIDHARDARFHTILSRVAAENGTSLHLHNLFGFERVGTMKEVGFKFGRFLDVEVFQLMIGRRV